MAHTPYRCAYCVSAHARAMVHMDLEPLNDRIKNFAILSVHLDELVLLVIFEFLLPIKEALEPIIKIAADDECLLDHQLMSHLNSQAMYKLQMIVFAA